MFPPRFISFHHAETAPSVDVHGRRQIKLVFTDHVLDVFISAIWKFLNQGEVDLAICEPIVGRVVNRPVFHKELHFVVPLAAVDINRNLVSLWDEVGSVAFGIGRQSITAKFPGQHRAAICQPIRLQPEFCTEEERLRKKEAAAVPEEEWARSKAEVRLTSRDDGTGNECRRVEDRRSSHTRHGNMSRDRSAGWYYDASGWTLRPGGKSFQRG